MDAKNGLLSRKALQAILNLALYELPLILMVAQRTTLKLLLINPT